MTLNKKDISKVCRYYNGTDTQPPCFFSNIERVWVKAVMEHDDFILSSWNKILSDHNLLEWANSEYPNIPTTLTGAILNRYIHFITCMNDEIIEEFKKYFKEQYIGDK